MLYPSVVANRTNGCAADLAGSFGDFVRHRENLRGLLVEKEVIVPEIWTEYVPMEILVLT